MLTFVDPNNRVSPSEPPTHHNDGRAYTISPARLAELRKHFLYWYFDKGGSDDIGDYQRSIHASNPQLHKNFNFQLPFYGFRFNYTRVSGEFRLRKIQFCLFIISFANLFNWMTFDYWINSTRKKKTIICNYINGEQRFNMAFLLPDFVGIHAWFLGILWSTWTIYISVIISNKRLAKTQRSIIYWHIFFKVSHR